MGGGAGRYRPPIFKPKKRKKMGYIVTKEARERHRKNESPFQKGFWVGIGGEITMPAMPPYPEKVIREATPEEYQHFANIGMLPGLVVLSEDGEKETATAKRGAKL